MTRTNMHRVALCALVVCAVLAVGVRANIPPCQEIVDEEPFSASFLWACDSWHGMHLANPMLLMIWISGDLRKWGWPALVAWMVSAWWELVEVIGVMILNNYVIFIGVTNVGYENVVDIVFVDWAIQAALGIALGMMYNWYWRPPVMWYGWSSFRSHWVQWLLWYALVSLPQITFSFKIDDVYRSFPLGSLITTVLLFAVYGFLIQHEPHKDLVWRGRSESDRVHFWVGALTIFYSFILVVQFDFFYSTIFQVWMLWLAWMIVIGLWAFVEGRGEELLRGLTDWSHTDEEQQADHEALMVASAVQQEEREAKVAALVEERCGSK